MCDHDKIWNLLQGTEPEFAAPSAEIRSAFNKPTRNLIIAASVEQASRELDTAPLGIAIEKYQYILRLYYK